ncbi:MAG: hypothetical protein ACK5V0_03615 [Alphaproteobacteria bacterium]
MTATAPPIAAAGGIHPLRRLFGYARGYRRDVNLATFYCVANKFCT